MCWEYYLAIGVEARDVKAETVTEIGQAEDCGFSLQNSSLEHTVL